jgi:hypothetical protein
MARDAKRAHRDHRPHRLLVDRHGARFGLFAKYGVQSTVSKEEVVGRIRDRRTLGENQA